MNEATENATEPTQTVEQPEVAEAGAEETPDLDALLAQYDVETAPPQQEPEQAQQEQYEEQESFIDSQTRHNAQMAAEYIRRQQQKETLEAIDSATQSMIDSTPELKGHPPKAVRGFLQEMAHEDPRIQQAFIQRDSNPQQWQKILKAAGRAMAKEYAGVSYDPNLTSNMESLRNAVNTKDDNESTPLTGADLARMSPEEYNRAKREAGLETQNDWL